MITQGAWTNRERFSDNRTPQPFSFGKPDSTAPHQTEILL